MLTTHNYKPYEGLDAYVGLFLLAIVTSSILGVAVSLDTGSLLGYWLSFHVGGAALALFVWLHNKHSRNIHDRGTVLLCINDVRMIWKKGVYGNIFKPKVPHWERRALLVIAAFLVAIVLVLLAGLLVLLIGAILALIITF